VEPTYSVYFETDKRTLIGNSDNYLLLCEFSNLRSYLTPQVPLPTSSNTHAKAEDFKNRKSRALLSRSSVFQNIV
jgi:hypothetical protein